MWKKLVKEMKKQSIGSMEKGKDNVAVGFVLINVAPAHEYAVHDKLSTVSEIIELYALFGEYDLIAKIEARNFEHLGDIIVNKIRAIEGVIDTRTLTATKVLKEP